MKKLKTILISLAIIIAMLWVGAAIFFRLHSSAGSYVDSSPSPLGGLFERAVGVSRLKNFMGELRAVYPAVVEFAKGHNDDLPKTVADLQPYLPKKLSGLNDEHWELAATGKMTNIFRGDTAGTVLFQQKDVLPGTAKIVVFADGHIEYKR